jgi:hypothetical protein
MIDTRQGKGISHFSKVSRAALSPKQPHSRWVKPLHSPGIKRPGRESEHPPLSGTEIVDDWSYKVLLFCAFVVCTGQMVDGRLK